MQAQQQATDTLYLGNLDARVTRRLVYELCCQAGPVARVSVPEEAPGTHKGYAFCQYEDLESAKYAKALFEARVTLFGRLRIEGREWATQHRGTLWLHATSQEPKPAALREVEGFYHALAALAGAGAP
ncbi:hypothetical protein WJX81_000557 [Elliptochloris bilobata]|uniref:RRM domain-containing protein n=1 Tax=Elliptochloris bilobata TaxID=381761 RepID=A0AAW1R478_9CHLO